MPDHTGVVIESQVDYLTVSAHGVDAAIHLIDYAAQLAIVEGDKRNKAKPWRMMGYVGTHIGAIDYGQRDAASAILRLAGDIANRELGNALSLADSVTRIDLATTWRADPPDPNLGANLYWHACDYWREHPHSAKPEHHGDPAGGYTAYLGARGGDYYFRCYNKEAECVHDGDAAGAERYKSAWRFELEIEKANPLKIANRYLESDDRPGYVQQYLWDYLTQHGIVPPFGPTGGQVLMPGFRRRSDADSKLLHLQKSVRPTVDWLRSEGLLDRALDALGLTDTG
jgi:hypothetical protein